MTSSSISYGTELSSHHAGRASTTTNAFSTPTTASTLMPQGMRLNICFKFTKIDGRRIVSLSTAVSARDVFVAVQPAFRKELCERSAAEISVTLPSDIFDGPMVLADGDETTWTELVKVVLARQKVPTLCGEICGSRHRGIERCHMGLVGKGSCSKWKFHMTDVRPGEQSPASVWMVGRRYCLCIRR